MSVSWRPILAWLASVAVATVIAVVVYSVVHPPIFWDSQIDDPPPLDQLLADYVFVALAIMIAGVGVGALPSWFLLREIRRRLIPRPAADLGSGIGIAVFALTLVISLGRISMPLVPLGDLVFQFKDAVLPIALGGAGGGITYWLLSGCARPPYGLQSKATG